MQFETFKQSIKDKLPPADITVYLLSMWYDGNGNWNKAHHLIDHLEDATACWVHAIFTEKKVIYGMQITGIAKLAKRGRMLH